MIHAVLLDTQDADAALCAASALGEAISANEVKQSHKGHRPAACAAPEKIPLRALSGDWTLRENETTPDGRVIWKSGWIATEVGSTAEVNFTAQEFAGRDTSNLRMSVRLLALRSYNHMGVVRATCVSGCSCEPYTLDAHIKQHVSVEHMYELVVSAAELCTIHLELLAETSSGGHKWKLTGTEVETNELYFLSNLRAPSKRLILRRLKASK